MTMELREKLAEAGRILAFEGQGDYVAGHISARIPDGAGNFLMKPAGIGLEEMSRDTIIVVNADGERIGGTLPRHNEVYIHSEVLRARPDVNAVVHTHPMHAVVFSSLGRPLLPLCADATIFADLPVFSETTDLIVTAARGTAVARCLAGASALILRNHGIVTAGETIEEAVYLALKLEKACQIQLMAEWAGGPRLYGAATDNLKRGARNRRPDLYKNVFDYVGRCACRAHAPGMSCEAIRPMEMPGRFTD